MNTLQKAQRIQQIKRLAESTGRLGVFRRWLELRQASESGMLNVAGIPDQTLAHGDGVIWTWRPNEGRAFIKAPVKVLEALEAIDALRPLPFTAENGDCSELFHGKDM